MKQNRFTILALLFMGASAGSFGLHQLSGKIEGFDALSYHKNTGGAPLAKTGAPGEGTCTDCHTGTAQNGNGLDILDWGDAQTYTPGETYSMTLTMGNGAAKNGFQLVALFNSDNSNAGVITVTDETRTNLLGTARKYLGHKSAGSTVSSWSFDWTAPETAQGPVTFYVVTNRTNSNNGTSGDVIYLSQHTFNGEGGNSASLDSYGEIDQSLEIGYQPTSRQIVLSFTTDTNEKLSMNVIGVNGQSVMVRQLGESYPGENKREVYADFTQTGIYVVHLFVGNKAYSRKIMVQ
jgi:hypothetical protein